MESGGFVLHIRVSDVRRMALSCRLPNGLVRARSAVGWLVESKVVPSRSDAVLVCDSLMAQGLIRCDSSSSGLFTDDDRLYQVNPALLKVASPSHPATSTLDPPRAAAGTSASVPLLSGVPPTSAKKQDTVSRAPHKRNGLSSQRITRTARPKMAADKALSLPFLKKAATPRAGNLLLSRKVKLHDRSGRPGTLAPASSSASRREPSVVWENTKDLILLKALCAQAAASTAPTLRATRSHEDTHRRYAEAKRRRGCGGGEVKTSVARPPSRFCPDGRRLPRGWFCAFDARRKRYFFYHPSSRRKTWTRPAA